MARFYAGNKLASFWRTNPSFAESTIAGTFDSTYVGNSIAMLGSNVDYIQSRTFKDAPSTTTAYVHGEWYGQPTDTYKLLEFVNLAGTVVAKIVCDVGAGGYQFYYWNGSAFVALGATCGIAVNTRQQLDMKIVAGAGGSIDIWKAGTSVVSASGGNAAFDNIAAVRHYAGSSITSYWSQIISTDFDLRNFRSMAAAINGNGADTAGTGSFSDINETPLNEATAIVLPAVGNAKSFTKASLTIPNGFSIDSAWANGRGRVSGGVVTDGKFGFRSAGTDYVSAGLAFNGGYEPRMHYTTTDPATGAAWTQASFNAAEIVAKAA